MDRNPPFIYYRQNYPGPVRIQHYHYRYGHPHYGMDTSTLQNHSYRFWRCASFGRVALYGAINPVPENFSALTPHIPIA